MLLKTETYWQHNCTVLCSVVLCFVLHADIITFGPTIALTPLSNTYWPGATIQDVRRYLLRNMQMDYRGSGHQGWLILIHFHMVSRLSPRLTRLALWCHQRCEFLHGASCTKNPDQRIAGSGSIPSICLIPKPSPSGKSMAQKGNIQCTTRRLTRPPLAISIACAVYTLLRNGLEGSLGRKIYSMCVLTGVLTGDRGSGSLPDLHLPPPPPPSFLANIIAPISNALRYVLSLCNYCAIAWGYWK